MNPDVAFAIAPLIGGAAVVSAVLVAGAVRLTRIYWRNTMLTAAFWTGTADRAVKSFAQALLLLWASDQGFNILEVSWPAALGLGGGAALLSVLTSIVSAPAGDKGSSSFLPGAA